MPSLPGANDAAMDDGVDLLDAHLRSLRYTVSAAARALRGADPGRLEAQCSSIDAGVGGLGRLRDDFVRLIDGALGAERPGAPADDARSARGHDLVSSLLGAALEEEAEEDGDAVEEIPLRKKSGGGDDVEELRPAAPATYDRLNGAADGAGPAWARAHRVQPLAPTAAAPFRPPAKTASKRDARADDKRAKGTVAPGARPRRQKNGASAGPSLVKSIFPEDAHAGPLQRQRNKSTMSREQRRISELHAELQDMGLQIVGADPGTAFAAPAASPAATPPANRRALRAATVQAADNRALVDSERISGFMADEGGYKDLQEPALGLRAGRVFQQNPIASPAAASRSSAATGGAIPSKGAIMRWGHTRSSHAERKEVKCAGERALEKHVITFMRVVARVLLGRHVRAAQHAEEKPALPRLDAADMPPRFRRFLRFFFLLDLGGLSIASRPSGTSAVVPRPRTTNSGRDPKDSMESTDWLWLSAFFALSFVCRL